MRKLTWMALALPLLAAAPAAAQQATRKIGRGGAVRQQLGRRHVIHHQFCLFQEYN